MEYVISVLEQEIKDLQAGAAEPHISIIDAATISDAIASCQEAISNLTYLCEGEMTEQSESNFAIPVVIERDLLEKTTGELTEYALALNGDICMPNEVAEMMGSKHRVLNLVKHLNHAL
jgi:hypothetical protein